MDLEIYEKKIFSQNGEDGVTIKLLDMIYGEFKNFKNFVEFGVQNGVECNTRILRERFGWKGLSMDGSHENKKIFLKKEFITKENIVSLFKKYNVPEKIDLLSVDIDFNDFYVLKEILKNYTCDIIICEYNSSHLPNQDKIIIYKSDGCWDRSNYFGASLLSLEKLANKYNYSLVYCDKKGINCFFVHNDKIKEKNLQFKNFGCIEKLYRSPKYGSGPNGGHPADKLNRKYITFEQAINL